MPICFTCPKKGARRLRLQRLAQSDLPWAGHAPSRKELEHFSAHFLTACITEENNERARRKRVNKG